MNAHAMPDDTAPQEGRVTPMMAQYLGIKAEYPDALLFYRMGDFYEMFGVDAQVASAVLGIVLTKRGKHQGEDIAMCGVPVERAEEYLRRLIANGQRVAVCEQVEDPAEAKKRGPKSIVARAVTRLVTPGTITEETLLDPAQANLLVALARRPSGGKSTYGVAAIDISTGRFSVSSATQADVLAELARLDPREALVPDDILDDPELRPFWRETRIAVTPMVRGGIDPASAERRIKEHFGLATLDSLGAFGPAETVAAALALSYVERTQFAARPPLSRPARIDATSVMGIDAATRANLELVRTQSGDRSGSLLSTIDRTVTAVGARALAERLGAPSTSIATITARHDSVEWLLAESALRSNLRADLRRMPDIPRAVSRLLMGRGGPRELAAVRDGLAAALKVRASLVATSPVGEIVDALAPLEALSTAWTDRFERCLADDLPAKRADGGFIREGCDPELDRLRELATDSRRVIAELQGRYVAETGVRTLRIKHNGQIGYFVEVPSTSGEEILKGTHKDTFIHRQTMSGAMRFSTVELGDLERGIASAGDQSLAIELALFEEMVGIVTASLPAIEATCAALAVVDLACAMAELASDRDWTRPRMTQGLEFAIEGGRHPVVEEALRKAGEPYVPNDCDLSGQDAGRICLVTGPNMGGKSTWLRANALVAILAQAGAFVPARKARLGVVDRLFSRVGASDDLARGRSTFMVEMVETAAILNQATSRSLVILDEIGRGTSTFDGLSIAWSTVEYLHERNGCRALFATHFHELTTLPERLKRLSNVTLKVVEHGGDVVFLHEVVPGAADRSYGLQVAKLAGLPEDVIARARVIAEELESERPTKRRKASSRPLEELPLFAPPPPPPPRDELREVVAEIDPDSLSPRQALDMLYRIREAYERRPIG